MTTAKEMAESALVGMKMLLSPLHAQIKSLTARLDALPVPADGKDGVPGERGADGHDGASVPIEDVQRMVEEAISALPKAVDGKDGRDGSDADAAALEARIDELVQQVASFQDKTAELIDRKAFDAEIERVRAENAQFKAWFDSLTPPKDGIDGADGKDVDPEFVKAAVAEAVALIPAPRDGADGKDGVSPDPQAVADLVLAAVAADVKKVLDEIPKPENGRDGRDGKPGAKGSDGVNGLDGFGFDDLQIEQTDERSLSVKFVKGDRVKAFPVRLAGFAYQGVFKEAEAASLRKGDYVTWGGSLFHVMKDAPEGVPEKSADFTLAVKRGRDGRDGERGKDFTPPKPVRA